MASAQVLPNSSTSSAPAAPASSRKQGHLEAGKKRLEEFRKKRAAQKVASPDHVPQVANENVEPIAENSDRKSTSGSYLDGESAMDSATTIHNASRSSMQSVGTANDSNIPRDTHDVTDHEVGTKVPQSFASSESLSLPNGYHEHLKKGVADTKRNHNVLLQNDLESHSIGSSLGFSDVAEVVPIQSKDALMGQTYPSQQSISYFTGHEYDYTESAPDHNSYAGRSVQAFRPEGPWNGTSNYGNIRHSVSEEKFADASGIEANADSKSWHSDLPANTNMASATSFQQVQFPSTSYSTPGRSRPSFLDSIGVSRVASVPNGVNEAPQKAGPFVSLSNAKSTSSFSQQKQQLQYPDSEFPDYTYKSEVSIHRTELPGSSFYFKDNHELMHPEGMNGFLSHGKDDDFAALEQLIEDLTQEKFSLQRALEASQTMADTLAADHSSLVNSYNQQGQVIAKLKSENEILQEEVAAQLLVLESIKAENAHAQLECRAADERAKVLATEVIALEEKALRLRSNELKLEKQVENLTSEISSYRRKVSSLEKERQDFQSTIDALQEEKKILHSKRRKMSAGDKADDIVQPSVSKRDASTSTDEFAAELSRVEDGEASSSRTLVSMANELEDGPSFSQSSNIMRNSQEGFYSIPPDQLEMIDNINSLISELAVERAQLMQKLKTESLNHSMLKELNREITQKLEAQTQRLELLTAQRMAIENAVPALEGQGVNDASMYTDEGDEVVERVLGWITKLFPRGTKRRTSKLL